MRPQKENVTLHNQTQFESAKRGMIQTNKTAGSFKRTIIIGSIIELLIIALVVWIMHFGINQAVNLTTLIAAIIAIISTPVLILLAYIQWRHPFSANGGAMPIQLSSQSISTDFRKPPTQHIPPSVHEQSSSSGQNQPMQKQEANVGDQPPDAQPLLLISYNNADQAIAEWINAQLIRNGYHTVLYADFVPGSNPTLEMDRALKQASHTLAVLSPAYLQKNQAEWANVFRTDPAGRKLSLIPIYVRDCSEELAAGLLGGIKPIDLVGKKQEESQRILLREIARSVDGKNERFGDPPPFPGESDSPHVQPD